MKVGIGTYSFGGIASYLGLGMTLLARLVIRILYGAAYAPAASALQPC